MRHSIRSIALASLVASLAASHVAAAPQLIATCPVDWIPTFGAQPGTDSTIAALTAFDDGTGSALFAGGTFHTAGAVDANAIAKWDGTRWSRLDAGVDGSVSALAVFDDGTGRALYAGGWFATASGVTVNGIAKWNGSAWAALSSGVYGTANPRVNALAVFDDGTGPALYAAGDFTFAGGVYANGIAKWDGTSWSPLAGGGSGFSPSPIEALVVFDDGGGRALYACGGFTFAGTVAANGIAKWDGTTWSALGSGLTSSSSRFDVGAMTVFDDGTGPALYVGGQYSHAGGSQVNGIARWNGSSWSGVGVQGLGFFAHDVHALTVFDDGGGATLYAGGYFSIGQPANFAHGIVKWNGSTWNELGGGVHGSSEVFALTEFDDGSGAALFAGGSFTTTSSGLALSNAAKWNGSSWSSLGNGLNDYVRALTTFDDGSGTALYVGGDFDVAGGQIVNRVARWNGTSWSALGNGIFGSVHAFAVFDDGAGPRLYAGGNLTGRIVKWTGSSWMTVGGGTDWQVSALAVHDDGTGPALYEGGIFSNAGGAPASRIARWNGSSWSALGTGISGAPGNVLALASFDDGTGPALYACGTFTTAGGLPVNNVARWTAAGWQQINAGTTSFGSALAFHVHDDGAGPALYMGGIFSSDGGATGYAVARWNGTSWSQFGTGMGGVAYALATFDDGTGPTLYAGGQFSTSGVLGARPLARWNGTTWTQLAGPQTTPVYALATFDAGSGRALYAGGRGATSPSGDSYLAHWGNPCPSGAPFCFGDGVLASCPCANHSSPGDRAGCLNSLGIGGKLEGTGNSLIAMDSLVLIGTRMTDSSALYFQGTTPIAGGAGAAFGDGLRCASGTLIRLGTKTNVNGASRFPEPGDPSVSWQGLVTTSGTRTYQVLYRNAAAFCTPDTFNLTNGLHVTWVP